MTPKEKADEIRASYKKIMPNAGNLQIDSCALGVVLLILDNEKDWAEETGSSRHNIKFWQEVIEELEKK